MAISRPMMTYSFVVAGILLGISTPRLVGYLNERNDIWWTPMAMAVPLAESGDRVEIYVRGEPLPRLLQEGRILLKTEAGSRALLSADVALRFNNWDRVRARRTVSLLGYASAAGAGALFLAFGLIGLFEGARRTA